MNSQKIRNSIMTVAVAGLLAAATACSSSDSFDTGDLITELSARGMEFEYVEPRSRTYEDMNGFATGADYEWEGNYIFVYEFIGRGEALIGASRIGREAIHYSYPMGQGQYWAGLISYCCPHEINAFHKGKLIARYHGEDSSLHDALQEIMGTPFAGVRVAEWDHESGEDRPHFESLWQERSFEVRDIHVRNVESDETPFSHQIEFEALTLLSHACLGSSPDNTLEVIGQRVVITRTQQVPNVGVARMAEPCDLDWRWEDVEAPVRDLTQGEKYRVEINGRQVATFTAS